MDEQLHSPARRLIELRMAHAELDGRIDALAAPVLDQPGDDLTLRRLKKQRLALRDEIARLERASDPDEPA
ncbi:YdcH family protein [Roseateles sp.]|jgi:hypothetical protein|uniref:YdcH family protein n=1 Tax=Roseateles sp. TaxID=1971397 RepID=UPI0031D0466C